MAIWSIVLHRRSGLGCVVSVTKRNVSEEQQDYMTSNFRRLVISSEVNAAVLT